MSKRRITQTTQTFTGTTYRVAGDPVPTGFKTRKDAEKRAADLDAVDAINDIIRNPNR